MMTASARGAFPPTRQWMSKLPINPSSCRVLILAAGQGRRLGVNAPPKVLLDFGGGSLLARHLRILAACGMWDITLVVGYQAAALAAEVAGWQGHARVELVDNPRFRHGSIASLWQARAVLRSGKTVILMDGDVLYDRRLIDRLLHSIHENCFLLDRAIEPGEEPVKLCIDQGRIVDFHKRPQIDHEWHGESVGFFRFSPAMAAELADRVQSYIAEDRIDLEYEEAIRDMLLARKDCDFGFEDVSGLPWIEIDFPADVETARRDVVPALLA
jgi:choline kinase